MRELEETRKSTLRATIITMIICQAVFIGIALIYMNSDSGLVIKSKSLMGSLFNLWPLLLACSLATIIARLINSKKRREFKQKYLEKFIKVEFEKEFSNVMVDIKGFSRAEIVDVNLIKSGNKFGSNDRITGYYRGMKFSKADVLMQDEHTDSDGNTSTVTLFKGQWIILEGIEKTVAKMFIVNKKLRTPSRKKWFVQSEFEKVESESIEFNTVFSIHSKDAHDAFYFLTPHMMERFLTYSSNVGFGASVFDNIAHLAIGSGRDTLEAKLSRPIGEKDYKAVSDDIEFIKSTIDILLEPPLQE